MPTMTAEDKAKAQEKQRADLASSVTGAEAVADAVKRVADAAVAETKKLGPVAQHDFTIGGTPGGTFAIIGNGFGAGGTVLVAGAAVKTTSWSNERIEGQLPAGLKSSEVVVAVDATVKQYGYLTVA